MISAMLPVFTHSFSFTEVSEKDPRMSNTGENGAFAFFEKGPNFDMVKIYDNCDSKYGTKL